jgi:phage shock protein PspC (stress-responsive transcriptional regulator)
VCAGLGRYFGLDPVLVRLVMVALVFAGGISILIYPILWLAMPVDTSVQPSLQPPAQQASNSYLAGYRMPSDPAAPAPAARNSVLGALMLGVGTLMLASYFGNPPVVLALLALAVGVYLLRK